MEQRRNERTCVVFHVRKIYAAIPMDRNETQKEAEKKLTYKNRSTEIQQMWDVKCVIPVIIAVTGTVTKGLKNLETIPGKHSMDSLQNTATLGHRTHKGKCYSLT
jgi:hypothetical protein